MMETNEGPTRPLPFDGFALSGLYDLFLYFMFDTCGKDDLNDNYVLWNE